MVLPQGLGIIDATKHAGDPPHQKPEGVLHQQHQAGGHAQVAVHGVEVAGGPLPDFVGLDDQDAGGEKDKGQQVERGVGAGPGGLVGGVRSRLQDEDGLGQDEDAGGLEQRVRAEERDQGPVLEGGGPDEGDEQDGARLGEPARSWVVGGDLLANHPAAMHTVDIAIVEAGVPGEMPYRCRDCGISTRLVSA